MLLILVFMANLGRMFEDFVDESELQRLLGAHELVSIQRGFDEVIGPPLKIGRYSSKRF